MHPRLAEVLVPESISIIIADDHPILREGIASLCATQPRVRVLGQCADGLTAVEMIRSLEPDFATIDLNMPKLDGIEVIRRVRQVGCPTKLMVLSVSRDERLVRESLRSGANAYLVKEGPPQHLFDAIKYVREGGTYLSPMLQVASLFATPHRTQNEYPVASLSHRENEVFSFLVNGVRPKDIARMLGISPKTVDTYRAGIMRKLGVHDLVGLVKYAIQQNLTSTSSSH